MCLGHVLASSTERKVNRRVPRTRPLRGSVFIPRATLQMATDTNFDEAGRQLLATSYVFDITDGHGNIVLAPQCDGA